MKTAPTSAPNRLVSSGHSQSFVRQCQTTPCALGVVWVLRTKLHATTTTYFRRMHKIFYSLSLFSLPRRACWLRSSLSFFLFQMHVCRQLFLSPDIIWVARLGRDTPYTATRQDGLNNARPAAAAAGRVLGAASGVLLHANTLFGMYSRHARIPRSSCRPCKLNHRE